MQNKILKLSFLLVFTFIGCKAQNKNVDLSEKLTSKATELIDELCEDDRFSGTIIVAKKDSVLYQFACGEASKRFHIKNNIDTKFNLGSNNKMFTGIAIMQLQEKGMLNLYDTIDKYIDSSWIPKKIGSQITIHHLLTHTSGLGDFFNSDFENGSKELFRNIEDFKPLIKTESLYFKPGSNTQYSNTGMLLLGVIIEKVSKISYFDYIAENIYKTSGMTNSDCYEMDKPIENLAIGYYKPESENEWRNNLYKHVIKGGPSGGGFSTVRDLHKFGQAILENRLISKSSMDILSKIHQKLDGPAFDNYGYGYGFVTVKKKNNKMIGHLGGFTGISSGFFISLENEHMVCVLSNYEAVGIQITLELSKLIIE